MRVFSLVSPEGHQSQLLTTVTLRVSPFPKKEKDKCQKKFLNMWGFIFIQDIVLLHLTFCLAKRKPKAEEVIANVAGCSQSAV